ncbi:hypothetical protein F5B20DRAFT_420646 [Whalleya microplaca]|nr:hypothetical protein F5B20DRAFT_420646 [Whalleya microplaca]
MDKSNLTRVRDNQRRSRARRKEYIQELEKRVRLCELQGVEASFEIQQAARRVAEENKKLRVLLNGQGFSNESINDFLRNGDLGPVESANPISDLQTLEFLLSRQPAKEFDSARPTNASAMNAAIHNGDSRTPGTLASNHADGGTIPAVSGAHGHLSVEYQTQGYPMCLTSDTAGLDAMEITDFSSQQSTPNHTGHILGDRRRNVSGLLSGSDKSMLIAPQYDTSLSSINYKSSMDVRSHLEGDVSSGRLHSAIRTAGCPATNASMSPSILYHGSKYLGYALDDQYSGNLRNHPIESVCANLPSIIGFE